MPPGGGARGGKFLTDEEIQDVAEIRAGSRSMKDLTGIEVFTNLRYLDCSGNDLTELDLSKNKKLQVVKCYSNKISGTNTDYLIEHLPTTTGGELYFIREWGESNKITEQQKAAAKGSSALRYTIVNEAGASVYSASKLATEEYPDLSRKRYLNSQL